MISWAQRGSPFTVGTNLNIIPTTTEAKKLMAKRNIDIGNPAVSWPIRSHSDSFANISGCVNVMLPVRNCAQLGTSPLVLRFTICTTEDNQLARSSCSSILLTAEKQSIQLFFRLKHNCFCGSRTFWDLLGKDVAAAPDLALSICRFQRTPAACKRLRGSSSCQIFLQRCLHWMHTMRV
jgi:hypothetical protein